MEAYHEEMSKKEISSFEDVINRVIQHPCKRFWVSEYRAANIISKMIKGERLENMSEIKREMFNEIYNRYLSSKSKYSTLIDAMFDIINSPAPKFYMSPVTATIYICKIKKSWYKSRMKKLHGLF
jgi:chemotaxis protein CheY-P-specific phosphatase CheC